MLTCTTRLALVVAVSVLSVVSSSHAQTYSWVKQYHGSGNLRTEQLAAAPSGDSYTTARLEGTISVNGEEFDGSGTSHLLLKHDGAGTLKWALPMNVGGIAAINANDDHVFISGNYSDSGAYVSSHHFADASDRRQCFVMRLTETGVVDLVVDLYTPDPGSFTNIDDMDLDGMGRMYITGWAFDNAVLAGQSLSNTGRPMYIARIDQDGSLGWVTTANAEGGASITTSKKADKIFVSCRVENASVVNFDNSTVTYSHTSDGNPFGGYFLLSCDNNGVVQQTKMLESSRFRLRTPMLELSDHNDLYLAMAQEFDNVTIMKFDTLMQLMWRFDDPDEEATLHSVAVDVSGNLLICGSVKEGSSFSGTTLGGKAHTGYVAKYDNTGNLMWVTGVLNTSVDDGSGIYGASISGVDADSHTDVFVSGNFNVPVEFPGHLQSAPVAQGIHQSFVARIRGLADYDGFADQTSGEMKIYPTINGGEFTICTPHGIMTGYSIHDLSGRCLYESTFASDQKKQEVRCMLAEGIYLLNVRQKDGGLLKGKIIVRH